MKHLVCLMALIGLGCLQMRAAEDQEVTLRLIETSDVHGCYFPYDFIGRRPVKGSLAQVSSFVNEQRKVHGDNLILMDNGDILQGQPIAYYYNFMDTVSVHVCADILNFMRYDVGNMGNHDVEAGPSVYNRWVKQCDFPVLGANIIEKATGRPYLKPYEVIERDGVKVVVLGMITPAVPSWLPEQLWPGLHFEDMETCAAKWVRTIRETEHPDVLVGLFHAGPEGNRLDNVVENASADVAQKVPGFDVVFMGHDHARHCRKIVNVAGDSVLIVDPANRAGFVSDVTIRVSKKDGKVLRKSVEGTLTNVRDYPADEAFVRKFQPQYQSTIDFVSRKIGRINQTISTKDAYFGPSAFIDLIHQLQLDISGADISFCAPLSFNAEIREGDIYMSDMFNLYKYENMLYVMQLSAAGIIYTVDVTKPQGEKIRIESMADGTPFSLQKIYKVAVNSYRGNGGGDLLTKGAGIPKSELSKRIVFSTDKDLRYYLMKRIEEVKTLDPKPLNQWRFVPEERTRPAIEREY